MTVLNFTAGGAPSFSLKLRGESGFDNDVQLRGAETPRSFSDTDSVATIKQRASKKLSLQDTSDIHALYEWHLVRYQLEDGQSHRRLHSVYVTR